MLSQESLVALANNICGTVPVRKVIKHEEESSISKINVKNGNYTIPTLLWIESIGN